MIERTELEKENLENKREELEKLMKETVKKAERLLMLKENLGYYTIMSGGSHSVDYDFSTWDINMFIGGTKDQSRKGFYLTLRDYFTMEENTANAKKFLEQIAQHNP